MICCMDFPSMFDRDSKPEVVNCLIMGLGIFVTGSRGPWSVVLGPWSLAHGPWSLAHGPWSWSLVPGPWSMVPGPWSLVRGPWPMVPGTGGLSEARVFHQSAPCESYGGIRTTIRRRISIRIILDGSRAQLKPSWHRKLQKSLKVFHQKS